MRALTVVCAMAAVLSVLGSAKCPQKMPPVKFNVQTDDGNVCAWMLSLTHMSKETPPDVVDACQPAFMALYDCKSTCKGVVLEVDSTPTQDSSNVDECQFSGVVTTTLNEVLYTVKPLVRCNAEVGDEIIPPDVVTNTTDANGKTVYSMTLESGLVCGENPDPKPNPDPVPPIPVPVPTPSSSSKCGVGCVFLILFFVGVGVYVAVFVVLNASQGRKGLDLIPHRSFWGNVCQLVKEGVLCLLGRSTAPQASGYAQVD